METLSKKESAVIEVLNFIKKYGKSFSVKDNNTVVVYTKYGNTNTYYIDDDGSIIGNLYCGKIEE